MHRIDPHCSQRIIKEKKNPNPQKKLEEANDSVGEVPEITFKFLLGLPLLAGMSHRTAAAPKQPRDQPPAARRGRAGPARPSPAQPSPAGPLPPARPAAPAGVSSEQPEENFPHGRGPPKGRLQGLPRHGPAGGRPPGVVGQRDGAVSYLPGKQQAVAAPPHRAAASATRATSAGRPRGGAGGRAGAAAPC